MMKEVESAAKKGLLSAALGTAASSIDRAVVRAMQMRNARVRARAEALDHAERMRALEAIASTYALDDLSPGVFFPDPAPITPRLDRVRSVGHVEVVDATWESRYEPYGADVRDRYLSHANNRSARARLFLSDKPRPAVILIHGYMGGQWLVEERQWPVSWLVRKGLDVVLPVLPFHAVRGDGGPPHFPGADPRYTNEGFRQAAHDLRSIVAFLRARGAPSVGVMGMSLGGFTTALLATVESELAFAVPMIPLVSIADFAREQGRFTGSPEEADLQHKALERANSSVSPLARPCLLPPERVLVIAAEADRITPIAHARKIADHFGARLVTIPGGHLLQIGRGDAFREFARLLGRLGILPPRR